MESDGRRALGSARLIAALLYAVPLVVFPMVGKTIQRSGGVRGELGRLRAGADVSGRAELWRDVLCTVRGARTAPADPVAAI